MFLLSLLWLSHLEILAVGNSDLSPVYKVLGGVTWVWTESCKIFNQITVGTNLLVLRDGLIIAEKEGLDMNNQFEVELLGRRIFGKGEMRWFYLVLHFQRKSVQVWLLSAMEIWEVKVQLLFLRELMVDQFNH